jgi:hypothetical protein
MNNLDYMAGEVEFELSVEFFIKTGLR